VALKPPDLENAMKDHSVVLAYRVEIGVQIVLISTCNQNDKHNEFNQQPDHVYATGRVSSVVSSVHIDNGSNWKMGFEEFVTFEPFALPDDRLHAVQQRIVSEMKNGTKGIKKYKQEAPLDRKVTPFHDAFSCLVVVNVANDIFF
jgi:hypothetical protein